MTKISLLAQIARTRLNVTVLNAKFTEEFERKCDGLVIQITVGKHKKKTHPFSAETNADLGEHRWDESFVFDIMEGCVAMKLRLLEKGILGDHTIGTTVVMLSTLPTKSKEDRWFELTKKNDKKVVAQVQLRVQLVPNETLMKISEGVSSPSNSGEYAPVPKTKSITDVEKVEGIESKAATTPVELPPIGSSLSPTMGMTEREREKEKEKEKESTTTFKLNRAKSEEASKSGTFNIFRGLQGKRKQKKNNLYRLLFNLPETEVLLFDVVASYVKRGNPLLIDGRLYVSQKYICFFSNIFGIKTTEVIALDEVVSIDQNADGLNAGVAITTKNNSYYFALTFGSSKTKVYEHLMSVWKREAISDADRAHEMNDAIVNGGEEEEEDDDDEYLSSATFGEETGFLSAEKMTVLIDEELPISVPRFRKMFFSDEPSSFQFVQTYHDRRGDTEFKMERWSNHPRFGTFRELQYRSPVNAPIGPKTTINAETQRYSLQKDHLIVETISVLRDIPYGDCFRVEGKWDVIATGKRQCKVVLKVGVYFLKRVLFRGTIENQTMKESADSYKIWLNLAKEEIKKLHPTREPSDPKLSTARKSPVVSPASSITNVHEPSGAPKTPPTQPQSHPAQASEPIEPQLSPIPKTIVPIPARMESSSLTMYFVTLAVLIFWALVLSWKVMQLSAKLTSLESELRR